MESIEDIDKQFPELSGDIHTTGYLVVTYMQTSEDAVFRWLMEQWHVTMLSIPTATDQLHSRTMLHHLGALALTMERVGIPEFRKFQAVAANMLRIFCIIHAQSTSEDIPTPGTVIH